MLTARIEFWSSEFLCEERVYFELNVPWQLFNLGSALLGLPEAARLGARTMFRERFALVMLNTGVTVFNMQGFCQGKGVGETEGSIFLGQVKDRGRTALAPF